MRRARSTVMCVCVRAGCTGIPGKMFDHLCMYVMLYMYVCMYVCMHVYVCMYVCVYSCMQGMYAGLCVYVYGFNRGCLRNLA